jgi:hypothetical protein
MTLNGSGVRDITRVLRVSINTVLKVIRDAAADVFEPQPPARLADVEVDEMWSFVEKRGISTGFGMLLRQRLNKSSRMSEDAAQMRLVSFYWIS